MYPYASVYFKINNNNIIKYEVKLHAYIQSSLEFTLYGILSYGLKELHSNY